MSWTQKTGPTCSLSILLLIIWFWMKWNFRKSSYSHQVKTPKNNFDKIIHSSHVLLFFFCYVILRIWSELTFVLITIEHIADSLTGSHERETTPLISNAKYGIKIVFIILFCYQIPIAIHEDSFGCKRYWTKTTLMELEKRVRPCEKKIPIDRSTIILIVSTVEL